MASRHVGSQSTDPPGDSGCLTGSSVPTASAAVQGRHWSGRARCSESHPGGPSAPGGGRRPGGPEVPPSQLRPPRPAERVTHSSPARASASWEPRPHMSPHCACALSPCAPAPRRLSRRPRRPLPCCPSLSPGASAGDHLPPPLAHPLRPPRPHPSRPGHSPSRESVLPASGCGGPCAAPATAPLRLCDPQAGFGVSCFSVPVPVPPQGSQETPRPWEPSLAPAPCHRPLTEAVGAPAQGGQVSPKGPRPGNPTPATVSEPCARCALAGSPTGFSFPPVRPQRPPSPGGR